MPLHLPLFLSLLLPPMSPRLTPPPLLSPSGLLQDLLPSYSPPPVPPAPTQPVLSTLLPAASACLALWVPMFPSAPVSWSASDLEIWPSESARFSRIALPFFLQQPRSHQLLLWERIMVWTWLMCPFLPCPVGWSTRRACRQSWGHVGAGGGLQQDRNAEECQVPAVAAPGPQLCPCL